jgi:gluconate 2-dehydrogenase alpha chain
LAYPTTTDEYIYVVHNKLVAAPTEAAVNGRYNMSETALPTRKWGASAPDTGVGGSSLRWKTVLIRPR